MRTIEKRLLRLLESGWFVGQSPPQPLLEEAGAGDEESEQIEERLRFFLGYAFGIDAGEGLIGLTEESAARWGSSGRLAWRRRG